MSHPLETSWEIDSLLTPYYKLVPKDFRKNLEYRKEMLEYGARSHENAQELWIMSARDQLFFINTFGWLAEPRKSRSKFRKIPFITYPYQDAVFTGIQHCIEKGEDGLIEKTRDTGVSWMLIYSYYHPWAFEDELVSFLLGSRKEEFVDKSGDPKCLFWKLDYILNNLPSWMKPNLMRNHLHLRNSDTESSIDGESTNENFATGDRRTSVGLDEFAKVSNGKKILSSTGDVTDCRIFVSTPFGASGGFYDRVKLANENNPSPHALVSKGGLKKFRIHWTLHPDKGRDAYFDSDLNKWRSPWYDSECLRRKDKMEIAQELDIDYHGSGSPFFDLHLLDSLQSQSREPLLKGFLNLSHEHTVTGFTEANEGSARLWTYPAKKEPFFPADRQYVMGVDIATGTGSSNSVITVADSLTREKVFEYCDPNTSPHTLAEIALAVARWFAGEGEQGALIKWEANGPGRIFGKHLTDLHYRRIWWNEDDKNISPKASSIPGWYSTKEGKTILLSEYRSAMAKGLFTNPCFESYDEAKDYVYLANGSVAHSASTETEDPSGARENHGDRVIADALCYSILDKAQKIQEATEPLVLPGMYKWRSDRRKKRNTEEVYW